MYIEYACYDEVLPDRMQKNVFEAIESGADGISVPITHLASLSNFLPEEIILSCPIDYPFGHADTELRLHYILKACRNKATCIDLVASSFLYYTDREGFISDIKAVISLCKDKDITIRLMIDYRSLSGCDDFIDMCSLIRHQGIEYIFCSTGLYSEDPTDNILLCNTAQKKCKLTAISNGNFYLPEQMDSVKSAHIFGVRFNNLSALKRCIVGV